VFTRLLNESMTVLGRSITADAYGGQSVSYTTLYTGRACRIDTLSAQAQAILSRSGIVATHKFFCEGDMTIKAEYVLVAKGVEYRVVNPVDVGAAPATTHHLEILTRTPS
jgi:hypothetical protein